LPEYSYVLGPRAGNKAPQEFNALFFDKGRLELLDSGEFLAQRNAEAALRELANEIHPVCEPGDLQARERRLFLPAP
jgi:hypothetical protein